jgi:hypothetical protein
MYIYYDIEIINDKKNMDNYVIKGNYTFVDYLNHQSHLYQFKFRMNIGPFSLYHHQM